MLLPPRSALKAVPHAVARIQLRNNKYSNLHASSYLTTLQMECVVSRVSEIVVSRHLSAIHFRDRFIRQVSCYTLLSGFRLPWPPSCCLYESTPFPGLWLSVALRLLNSRTFGSSHIASSAYQMWPTCDLQYYHTFFRKSSKTVFYYHLKV